MTATKKNMMNRSAIDEAERFLKYADPALGAVIGHQAIEEPPVRDDYFASLARTIIGQQISVASARATTERLVTATAMDPARIAALDDDEARAVGLSRQKTGYIRDLAGHFIRDPGVYNHLDSLDDDAVIEELVRVKGIGIWSAQMFLLFTLGRPDVFAPADIGVQNAMIRIYDLQKPLKAADLEAIAQKWSPYRSVALLHLWQSLYDDPLVVD